MEDCEDVERVFDDDFISMLLGELSQLGEVILIRFVENTMWVTFTEGTAALEAVKLNNMQVPTSPIIQN